ncbi:amiloride-sensitive sodium channel subunit alpha-like [Bombina bombina]|uniref:amiloride-sensitive sodium channel subunit alpha-like n=1 Tax=Bombina bombina TaxID=8345 RepID=UPI00235AD7DC|nr:amiloride-sensitive sodium channel subunit alpha-like [Bombina bombina]
MEKETKEEREGWFEFYDSFEEMFEFFCSNTTIHGTIRLICSKRNKMKTTFWIVLFLLSFGLMYWQFGEMFGQYWAYPTSTIITVQSKSKIFPAVTICNLNPYRFDEVNEYLNQLDNLAKNTLSSFYGYNGSNATQEGQDIVDLTDILHNGTSEINGRFQLDSSIRLVKLQENGMEPSLPGQKIFKVGFKLCNASGGDCYYKSYWSGVDAIHEWYKFHFMNIMYKIPLLLEISKEEIMKKFIIMCEFNEKSCSDSEYTHFHHPIYGNCFTFNSQGKDEFWKSSKTGKEYGLSLTVKADQNDNMPILSTVAGARIMVHNPFQPPLVEHEGFDIWPGRETSISIRQDEVNHLGGQYGKCTTDGSDVDIKLLYNTSYTLQACLQSCFQYKMVETCGCGYYFYPLPSGIEYCNYNKHPGWGHCFYRLFENIFDHRLNCFNKCPKHCTETIYKLSAGSAKWPTSKAKTWLIPYLYKMGYNSTSSRNDIAKINIYYEELGHRTFDETPAISVNLLLSNMGGQWSLWFGSSVLSVAEIAELVFDTAAMVIIITYQWQKNKRKANINDLYRKVNSDNEEPKIDLSLPEKYKTLDHSSNNLNGLDTELLKRNEKCEELKSAI